MLLFKALFIVLLTRGLDAQNDTEDDDPETKIVGGQRAAEGAYPFMASLRRSNNHFCGGTIIAAKYILTAAHCITSVTASQITVYVGTNTLSSGGTPYKVSNIIKHSGYNPSTNINDIALLQLSSSITMSTKVKTVTRASCLNDNTIYSVTAVGWGYQSNLRPQVSNTLQYVNLLTKTHTLCKLAWNSLFTSNQVCAVFPFRGVCSGDSGGPLLYKGEQIGITSFGSSLGCATLPDVYTKVCNYASWISSNMK